MQLMASLSPIDHLVDLFKLIFLFENCNILIQIYLIFVPNGQITYNPALVKIMDWRRFGAKLLSKSLLV